MGETRSTVFVACLNGGYEGYGKPLAVFATRELALTFLAGAEAAYSASMEVFEMPVQGTTLAGAIAPIETHPRLFALPVPARGRG